MRLQQVFLLLPVIAVLALTAPDSRAQENVVPEVSSAVLLPDEPAPNSEIAITAPIYVRPSEKQKLSAFEFDAFGPHALSTAIAIAGFQQHADAPPEWGQGIDSFGARLGSNVGIESITVTSRYAIAEVVREDTIYYPCACKGFFRRLGHAMISTVTARRGEDGHTVFSISGIVSPYVGSMTALAWYPDRYGVKDGFRMGNYNLAGQAAKNVAFEFIYGGPHAMFGRNHINRAPWLPRQTVSYP
jgi:hypothetical protein